MSRKHNTKHGRTPGHYARRLLMRGETASSVRMPFIHRDGSKSPTITSYLNKRKGVEDE